MEVQWKKWEYLKDLNFGHLIVDAVDKTPDFHSTPTPTPCDHTANSGFLVLRLASNEENLKTGSQILAFKSL